jgi:hypothetical protein
LTARYFEDGKLVQEVPRRANQASYLRDIARSQKKNASGGRYRNGDGPPVAMANQWAGSAFSEHEMIKDGKRCIRVFGREFLGAVQANHNQASTLPIGARLLAIPLAPTALGGRLALYAHEYEEHELHMMKVVYEPVVPTSTSGALAMYFRNDIGIQTLEVGRAELAHASTHPSFVQTSVWDPTEMLLDPDDVMLEYFDEEVGDFRMEVQGLLTVIAASGLDLTSSAPYGNVYIEYDFTFTGAELDYEIEEVPSIPFTIEFTASNSTITEGKTVILEVEFTPAPHAFSLPVFQYLAGNLTKGEIQGYLFYGVIDETLGDAGLWKFSTVNDDTNHTFVVGQALWFRFMHVGGTEDVIALAFADLASAQTSATSLVADEGGTEGQLYWAVSQIPIASAFTAHFHGRWWRLADNP